MPRHKYHEIESFQGGLNLKTTSKLIKPDEAFVVDDALLDEAGAIESRLENELYLTKANIQTILKYGDNLLATDNSNLYTVSGEGVSSTLKSGFGGEFQAIEYGDFLYFLNGTYFYKYNGTDITQVGIETPVNTGLAVAEKTKNGLDYCTAAWTIPAVPAGLGVTSSYDESDFREGAGSVKITVPGGLGATAVVAHSSDFTAVDLSSSTDVGFWIKVNTGAAAGEIQLLLDDTTACASPLETISLPTIRANTWTYVVVDLANPASDTAIICVGLKLPSGTSYPAVARIDGIVAGGGPLSGRYVYYVSYYSEYGQDSALSAASDAAATTWVSDSQISITGIPLSSDSQVEGRKIWRTGGTLSSIMLVDTIEDNTTTTYTDKTKDTDLTTVCSTSDHTSPQANVGKWLEECDGRFWMAGDTDNPKTLYISRPGIYKEAWPLDYTIGFSDDITGIKNINENLVVFTKKGNYKIIGDTVDNFDKNDMAWDGTCYSPESVRFFRGYLVLRGHDGVYITTGNDVPALLSGKIGDYFTSADTDAHAEVSDNKYFVSNNSKVIVADLLSFPEKISFVRHDYNPNCFFYDKENLVLYSGDITGIYTIGSGAEEQFTWRKNQIKFEYANLYSYLRKMWININGTLSFSIYLDGSDTASYTGTAETSSITRQEFSFPATLKCKTFDLEITCTGKIEPPLTFLFLPCILQ